jgi:nucleotide-binding universal stress UspA family protein/CBS domain-containing protein
MSENGKSGIELATGIAQQNHAKIVFIHVATQWIPQETLLDSEYVRNAVEADQQKFLAIRPTNDTIEYEHLFVFGNPGPEIIRASRTCDLIVLSTHGHTGLMRILIGSVAQYVMRHATVPVITYKNAAETSSSPVKNTAVDANENRSQDTSNMNPSETKNADLAESGSPRFVTELMHHVAPIRSYEKMEDVIPELAQANQTSAPVINEIGCCQGILTQSDICQYHELKKRFEARDETVIDEIFETDEFGQRRAGNWDFDRVHRHMTSPVVTISNDAKVQTAQKLLESQTTIHHLVVIDDENHPIGILDAEELKTAIVQRTS